MSMISLVLPVYNDEERILSFYQTLLQNAKEHSLQFECIFIDNGSRDQTVEVLRDICDKDFRFRFMSIAQNISIVGALYIGALYTQGDILVMMDLNHPSYMVSEFYKSFQKDISYVGGILRKSAHSKKSIKQRFFKAFKRSTLQTFFDEEDFDGFRSFIKYNHSDLPWIPYTNLEKQEKPLLIRIIQTLNYHFGLSIIFVFLCSLICSLIILPLVLILYFQLDAIYSIYIAILFSVCILLLITTSHARFCCVHIQRKIEHLKGTTLD